MMFYRYAMCCGFLLASLTAVAGQPMKCVDGSGRVIYTELSSCVEAFRISPTPPSKISPQAAKAAANKAEREQLLKEANQLKQQINDRRYKEKLDADYQVRQRLMAEEERQQQECTQMLTESDRRYNDAQAHGNDNWWRKRSTDYDQEMEQKCGHQVRLRRN